MCLGGKRRKNLKKRIKNMKESKLFINSKIKAIFRKRGRHTIAGEVFDICTESKSICRTWISIHVTGGDLNDPYVQWMVSHRINCLIPLCDVLEVL